MDEFYNEPTNQIASFIDDDMAKSIVEYLTTTDEFGLYIAARKFNHNLMVDLVRKVREAIEEFVINEVKIETENLNFSKAMEQLIFWSFDMVDWFAITDKILQFYDVLTIGDRLNG